MNDSSNHRLAHNVTRLAHMELPGAGQVYVEGGYAYLGHLTNAEKLGTTILDIADPRKPRMVSQIFLDDPSSHSHKARVVGDIMIVNSEQNGTALGRKGVHRFDMDENYATRRGRAPRRGASARISISSA